VLAIALNTAVAAVVRRFVILGEAKDLCTRRSAATPLALRSAAPDDNLEVSVIETWATQFTTMLSSLPGT
jgi:hypothetical protein